MCWERRTQLAVRVKWVTVLLALGRGGVGWRMALGLGALDLCRYVEEAAWSNGNRDVGRDEEFV